MSPKNLNVSNKTHKNLLNKLRDKRIFQIYRKFENIFKLNQDFIVGVSGGPDSLALCFLSKIYSIKKDYYSSVMFDETNAVKKDKTIVENISFPLVINEVILNGSHVDIANLYSKVPFDISTHHSHYNPIVTCPTVV